MNELEKRERLFKTIADVKDEHTRKVLYSQFVDEYYPVAFDSILKLWDIGQIHRVKSKKYM